MATQLARANMPGMNRLQDSSIRMEQQQPHIPYDNQHHTFCKRPEPLVLVNFTESIDDALISTCVSVTSCIAQQVVTRVKFRIQSYFTAISDGTFCHMGRDGFDPLRL